LVHRAHRLLSESTRILCTLRNRPSGRQTPGDFSRVRARSLRKTPVGSESFLASGATEMTKKTVR
jgi:hypothetical protein